MKLFKESAPLPAKFGFGIDERVVEYPWFISRLPSNEGRLLDAGSSLNVEIIVRDPVLANKELTIVTLAPESHAFWQLGISYLYTDLRDIPVRDEYFDWVCCISTIEHVGMDNTVVYNAKDEFRESNRSSYQVAIKQMIRVLRPGGKLFVTVPFGRYEDHGWFQQFDAQLLADLITEANPREVFSTFFRYSTEGWQISSAEDCANDEYFDIRKETGSLNRSSASPNPDLAAGARAVACLELIK